LAALGIGGLVFTCVAGATGLRVPWAQSRTAQAYGGMMAAGASGAGYAGMMGGQGSAYGGMMGRDPAGTMIGPALAGSARQVVSPAEAQSLSAAVPAGATVEYTYLCPVPGHAQRGMHGAFDVIA